MTGAEILRANDLVFGRLALMMNERPDFIDEAMVGELVERFGMTDEEAYSELLCSALGFDTDHARDKELWHAYSKHMVKKLGADEFTNDPFYKLLSSEETRRSNGWELTTLAIPPYSLFVRGDPLCFPDGRIIPQVGFFDREYRYPAVLQDGREWMTLLPNEIISQRKPIERARGRVLTYGLGLGYFAYSAANKQGVESVTVVERDADVIALFNSFVLPKLPCADKIKVVCADAFDYAEHIAPNGKFDYIFADIWHDPSDGVELYKRLKTLEIDGNAEYGYWIEDTLKLYMED